MNLRKNERGETGKEPFYQALFELSRKFYRIKEGENLVYNCFAHKICGIFRGTNIRILFRGTNIIKKKRFIILTRQCENPL